MEEMPFRLIRVKDFEVLEEILKLRWYRDYNRPLDRTIFFVGGDSLRQKTLIFQFKESKGVSIHLTEAQKTQISKFDVILKWIGRPNILAYDIFKDSICIGFAMLRKYEENGFFLWNYAIDENYQNQGYGTKALYELLEYLKSRFHAKEVSTTYLWGNICAKHLYEKVGFIETDIVEEDGIHEVNLSLNL